MLRRLSPRLARQFVIARDGHAPERRSAMSLTLAAPVIAAVELSKLYPRGRENVHALNRVSFEIGAGEFVAIVGPSGAGKTTLLNLLGCMDAPTAGVLRIAGREVQELSERERTVFRRDRIGFVFQHFSLLPTLNVEENVALPALFARRDARARVSQL